MNEIVADFDAQVWNPVEDLDVDIVVELMLSMADDLQRISEEKSNDH